MKLKARIELSVMMFLEFFVWGAWYVTMGTYLGQIGFQGTDIGSAYSTTAWAAIISPFFVGMIADRFFDAEKVLGVMHILGAILMYYVSTITEPGLFFWVLLGYAICYMPTIALVNAISFNQMEDPKTQFPPIRVLGTLGWIVAGIIISLMKAEPTVIPLQMAAGASLVMGIYSFFLPKTPPKSVGKKVTVSDVLGLDALKLMKDFSFAIFVIGSLLVCIPLSFYYNFANLFLTESGMVNSAAKMSLGQASEFFFMLVMPFFFVRLGVKKMLLVGMLAWVVRYVLFAFGNNDALVWMFYIGILLHGICYDFFFVTGMIYVDNKAPVEIRANAQGFIALITYGVGMVIGAKISGIVVEKYQIMDAANEIAGHQWQTIWLIPAAMAGIVMIVFALAFRDNGKAKESLGESMPDAQAAQ
jgi:nucleoside transporter